MVTILETAPHSIDCRCDECLAEIHSYHDEVTLGCPICYPACRMDPQPAMIRSTPCYKCPRHEGEAPMRRETGRTRTIEPLRDPTESYELECGHWAI